MSSESPNAIKVTPEMVRAVTEYMQKVQTVTYTVKCQRCGHPECEPEHWSEMNNPDAVLVPVSCPVCDKAGHRGLCAKR